MVHADRDGLIGTGAQDTEQADHTIIFSVLSVPDAPFSADNTLATLEVRGRGLVVRWDAGEVHGERYDQPDTRQVARVAIS